MVEPTLVYLPNLDCVVVDMETVSVCGAGAVYMLIGEHGQYTGVCQEHLAIDKEGRILPAIKGQIVTEQEKNDAD